ncbi:MAG: WecB/TagA/CpsF family glycosyltransferase [Muribaculaceae bacterium]|nr:WecB/TagA/CpsF family glycosyltransferase [Muribaculaceae bacterium]
MTTKEFITKIHTSASKYPNEVFSVPGKIYTCVNSFSYHIFRKNPALYKDMDGLFVDGFTMCWWIKTLWGHKIPRLSFDMTGMAVDLFEKLENGEENIYFVGARQDDIENTMKQIRSAYPKIRIAGYRNGYFLSEKERADELRNIVALSPDFTIVGMGLPLQENFASDLRKAGYKGIVFTCGGFLHQTVNSINYYPAWINKYNLRAFYRLYKEKGLFKRLYYVLLEFPVLFTYDSLKAKLSKSDK